MKWYGYLYGFVLLGFLSWATVWIFGFLQHLRRTFSASKAAKEIESGIFVDHGFEFDEETGRAIPTKSPSSYAQKHLDAKSSPSNY